MQIGQIQFSCYDDVIEAKVSDSNLGPIKSDTKSPMACHRCDVFSELCCPMLRRKAAAMDLANRCTLRRDNTSIIKIWF